MPCLKALRLCLVLLFAVGPALAEPLAIPGTPVTMTPPAGYRVSERFSGLEHPASGGSFLVNMLPATALPELTRLFQSFDSISAGMRPRGVSVTERHVVDVDGAAQTVYRGSQAAGGLVFDKYLALYAGDAATIVSFQAPEGAGPSEAAVLATFASVRLRAALSLEEKLAALPFTFGPLGEVRLVDVLSRSGAYLTIGPKDRDPAGAQPTLIISTSLSKTPTPDDLERHGAALLATLEAVERIDVIAANAFAFDGASGMRLVADAVDRRSGRALRLMQWMRYSDEGYLRVLGLGPLEAREDFAQAFQAVVDGVKMRR